VLHHPSLPTRQPMSELLAEMARKATVLPPFGNRKPGICVN
jgi:hypothetical protein